MSQFDAVKRWAAIAGLACIVAAPAAAIAEGLAPAMTTEASAAGAERSGLYGAKMLKVQVVDYPSISGEFRVNADGSVSIPGLGRLALEGHDVESFETALQDRVLEVTGRFVEVSVTVEERRPVFVTGLVQAPGAYAFQPDMTVLQAVTVAGGVYRAPAPLTASGPQGFETARLDLMRARSELKTTLARWARLDAERVGVSEIRTPERLIGLVGSEEAARLIEAEQVALNNVRETTERRIEAINNSIDVAEREIAQLNDLSQSLSDRRTRQLDLSERLESLRSRDLIPETRLFEVMSALADIEERMADVRVSIARAEAVRLEQIGKRIEIEEQRRAAIDAEMAQIETQLDQLQLGYEVAASKAGLIGVNTADPEAGRSAYDVIPVTYAVVRRRGGALQTLPATAFTELAPGDVIVVCERFGEGVRSISPTGECLTQEAAAQDAAAAQAVDIDLAGDADAVAEEETAAIERAAPQQ